MNKGATITIRVTNELGESERREVEVDIGDEGLPSFTIVGLPDKAVEEAKERVRSAIKNTGADFPSTRITVNLAPADLPKVGPSYDLPIALGILIASGQIKPEVSDSLFFGELSLDGSLRHTNGILPMTYLAREKGFQKVIVPKLNEKEAAVVPGVKVYPIENLLVVPKKSLRSKEKSIRRRSSVILLPRCLISGLTTACRAARSKWCAVCNFIVFSL